MSFENFCIVSQGNLDFKFQKIKIAIEDIVMLQSQFIQTSQMPIKKTTISIKLKGIRQSCLIPFLCK